MRVYVAALVATFSLLAFHPAKSQTARTKKTGQQLFEKKCAPCHGNDGTKGAFGARNLQASTLIASDLVRTIAKGRGRMPAWEKKLTPEEIQTIAAYVQSLRKGE